MSLKKSKLLNQYNFSGGINISNPGYLIKDDECYANITTYDGTKNVFWDAGIIRRSGTQKVNTYKGIDKIDRGNCESLTSPMVFDETIPITSNCSWAREGAEAHGGSYSYRFVKSIAPGTSSYVYLVDVVSTSDMHGLIAGHTYTFYAWIKIPTASGILGSEVAIRVYDYEGGWAGTLKAATNTYDEWQLVTATRTIRSSATGVYILLQANLTAELNEYFYGDDIFLIDEAEKIVNGIRFYRSETPTITTFSAANYCDETKILYLDDDNEFQEVTGGSTIDEDEEIFFAKWKDSLYVTSSDQVIQKITYSSGWSKADISGNTSKPQYILQHKDRLWAAGGDMNEGTLECSAYEYDDNWSGDDGELFNVGFKDGDPITQLIPLGDNLIIYKNDSIWVMKGDNLYNWFQDREEEAIGCCAPKSVVDVGFGHIFLSADNIYYFDGKNLAPIGNSIKPWLDAIPTSLRSHASAIYYNGFYRISFASNAMTDNNNMELLLDLKYFRTEKISWWLYTERNIAAYIPYNGAEDDQTIVICDDDVGYIRQIDIGTQDDDVNIPMEFHSKYFTFDEPNVEKIYDHLKIDSSQGIGNLTLEIIKNLNDAYTLPITIDASGGGSTFGSAILGTTYWTSQGKTRLTTDVALPSELDGYSICYHIEHSGNYDNVVFYGFTISYAYKRF